MRITLFSSLINIGILIRGAPDPEFLDPAVSGSSMILALPYLLKAFQCVKLLTMSPMTYHKKNLSSVLLRLHFMSVSIAKC